MVIKVNGRKLVVFWQHTTTDKEIENPGGEPIILHDIRSTYCFIRDWAQKYDPNMPVLASGKVEFLKPHTFKRDAGRKMSLTEALKDLGLNEKEQRAPIYEIYKDAILGSNGWNSRRVRSYRRKLAKLTKKMEVVQPEERTQRLLPEAIPMRKDEIGNTEIFA